MSKRLFVPLVLVIASLAAGPEAAGESVTAQMGVHARVLARAVLDSSTAPAKLVISEDDVRAGFVRTRLEVRVRTNDGAGVGLLARLERPFSGAEIRGPESAIMGAGDVAAIGLGTPRVGDPLTAWLDVSIDVSGLSPGSYSWPLRLEATPASSPQYLAFRRAGMRGDGEIQF